MCHVLGTKLWPGADSGDTHYLINIEHCIATLCSCMSSSSPVRDGEAHLCCLCGQESPLPPHTPHRSTTRPDPITRSQPSARQLPARHTPMLCCARWRAGARSACAAWSQRAPSSVAGGSLRQEEEGDTRSMQTSEHGESDLQAEILSYNTIYLQWKLNLLV